MQKLVFDYTHCSEPECWEWNKPFEYESKEKFILDVIENPMVLSETGIVDVYSHELAEGSIYQKDYYKNVDEYVFTLDEWFERNKTTRR